MRVFAGCLVAMAVLMGCSGVREVRGPEGRTAYEIECSSIYTTCLKKAEEKCPAGYNIVHDNSAVVGNISEGIGSVGAKVVLTVACK